ncbi:hypothetical protein [Streptomyces sp. NPDC093111]|uniref:hypothetical protein n=1 Tax=Streptomyces sp. NPDC093111 TaxID=3154978 RepID=UPI003445814B
MSALDGAERLRQPARLPYPDIPLKAVTESSLVFYWVASSTWVVDHLLRAAGIHTCPPPRSSAIFYAPMHGGASPTVGNLDRLSGLWTFWTKNGAPFESAMNGTFSTAEATYRPAVATVNRTADGLWLEGWANTTFSNPNTDQVLRYKLQYDTGTDSRYVAVDVNFLSGTLTASHGANADPALNQRVTWTTSTITGPGTYHFGWWLRWSSTGVPTIAPVVTKSGGTAWVGADQSLSTTPSPPGELRTVNLVVTNLRIEAMQISQLTAKPATDAERTLTGTWSKGATLGTPAFPMAAFPSVSGDTWSVLTDIARATLSTIEIDRDGFVRWQDFTRWAAEPTAPVLTISSARELGSLTVTEEIDACRNDVTVRWQNWAGHDYEPDGITDTPASPIAVAAGASITRSMPMSEDRYDPTNPVVTSDILNYGRLVIRTTASATAPVVHGAAEFSVRRDGGMAHLTIRNRSTATFYYHASSLTAVKPSQSTGTPVISVAVERDIASQAAYGVQSYTHEGSPWIQDASTGTEVARALIRAGAYPSPQLQNVEVLPDPRIDLGDLVRVADTTGAQLDTFAWVVGVRTEGSGTAVRQTLALRGAKGTGAPTDTGLVPDPPTRPGASPPT